MRNSEKVTRVTLYVRQSNFSKIDKLKFDRDATMSQLINDLIEKEYTKSTSMEEINDRKYPTRNNN